MISPLFGESLPERLGQSALTEKSGKYDLAGFPTDRERLSQLCMQSRSTHATNNTGRIP